MSLIDLIESRRFLGQEFLVWLWYKCDVFEGRFMVGERDCEVWFDDRITLEAILVETEQSVLKGASPTFTPEAREALRQGKTPTVAKLRLMHDGQEFQFAFKGAALQLSGVKLPSLMTRTDDEKFFERMFLLELLEELIEDLYGEFLGLRLSQSAWTKMTDAIQVWIHDEKVMEVADYRDLRATAPPLARIRENTKVAERDTSAAQEEQASAAAESDLSNASEAPPAEAPPAEAPPAEAPPAEAPSGETSSEAPAPA
jgi:hypothetical protein